jgi:hypothetical protein
VDLYSVAAPTTARKESAQMATNAYDERLARKTRADQVKKAATDAEAAAGLGGVMNVSPFS